MNVTLMSKPANTLRLLSLVAKASGVVLVVGWVVFVVAEFYKNSFEMPDKEGIYQGVLFAMIFAGYFVSIRHALVGSMTAIIATLVFFVVAFITSGVWPAAYAALFALPAVLTLVAWGLNRRRKMRGD